MRVMQGFVENQKLIHRTAHMTLVIWLSYYSFTIIYFLTLSYVFSPFYQAEMYKISCLEARRLWIIQGKSTTDFQEKQELLS